MIPFVELNEKKLFHILKGYKKIFFVHGKKSYELCGAKRIFSDTFSKLKCQILEFYDFADNPKWEDVERGINDCRLFNPDLIIAVGGGSVIDIAKCIKFFFFSTGNPSEIKSIIIHEIPFFAFPTTSGTGSEATHFAVCYYKGKKYSIANRKLIPTKVFIDYNFTLNNPLYLTACTGCDALCQAIESYWSVKSTLKSRYYSLKAIKLIYNSLDFLISSRGTDKKSRIKISKGAYYAGKAINITTTTAAHAYSYEITKLCSIPHGHAVAITFPFFFNYNINVNESNCNDKRGCNFVYKNINKLKKYFNFDNAIDFFQFYFDKVFLNNYKIKLNPEIINSVLNGVNIQRLGNNPAKVDESQLKKYLITFFL